MSLPKTLILPNPQIKHLMLVQLTQDMKAAMRAREKDRLNTIRAIIAELKNSGIDKKGAKGLVEEVASPAEHETVPLPHLKQWMRNILIIQRSCV